MNKKRYFNEEEIDLILSIMGEAIEERDKKMKWGDVVRKEVMKSYTKLRNFYKK